MGDIRGIESAKSATPRHQEWVRRRESELGAELASAVYCPARSDSGTNHVINRGGVKSGVCIHCRAPIWKRADGRWVTGAP